MNNSRRAAAQALVRVEKDGAYSNIVLNETLKSSGISGGDAAFVSALFYGVLERKLTLDYYIRRLSSQPLSKISPLTKQVLRCGLYQIVYMDKIPDSAAVNESVNIIKHSKESRSAGYVNALLRHALRELPKLPNGNSAENLSVLFSCDISLTRALIDDYGAETAKAILKETLKPSAVIVRVNTLKTNAHELTKCFENDGITVMKTRIENALSLSGCGSIENNKYFKEGFFHVQDVSSQLCAESLGATVGDRVLDICAAPGGKTFTVAEEMKNKGAVISCDLYPQRVKLISDGAYRLGLDCIETAVSDATVLNHDFVNSFDRVLCDVPCSGSGIIGRKPDIKYKDFFDNLELFEIQKKILSNGFEYLKSGGRLVYSTCSILKVENEETVNRFCDEHKNAKIINQHTYLPHIEKTDGFFTAVIEKTR